MAYRRKAKVYSLEWADDTPFAGLKVKVKALPVGKFLKIAPQIDALGAGDDVTAEQIGLFLEPLEALADAIISWTIEDESTGEDGETVVTPVPPTLDGVLNLEPAEITAILRAWIDAGTSVSAPLGKPLTSGRQGDSLSMEEFLASLPNSSEPALS